MRRLRTHDLSPFNVSFQEFIHSIGKRWYKHTSKSVWKVDLKHKLTSVKKKEKIRHRQFLHNVHFFFHELAEDPSDAWISTWFAPKSSYNSMNLSPHPLVLMV